MTPEQCRTKRNELLAQARAAERLGTLDGQCVAERCRTLASNLDLMASGNSFDQTRGLAMYEKNRADFEAYLGAPHGTDMRTGKPLDERGWPIESQS